MTGSTPSFEFPPIPTKRYFTIGEVAELCHVKTHVLRYWEQEFPQLKPMKRAGNRRYYQRHDVLMVREISNLLYERGFTIAGARQYLLEGEPKAAAVQDQALLKQMLAELQELAELLDPNQPF